MPRSQQDFERAKRRHAWQQAISVLAVALCTAVVFAPVLYCDFLRWDDQDTISQNRIFNPRVNWDMVSAYWDPNNAQKSLWYPVTCTLWAVVASISPRVPGNEEGVSLSPILFHLLNLLIHCGSATMAYAFLRRLVKSNIPAFMGALFYALHPVMVEPVAWASGTKDVLAGFMSLLTIYEYARFRDPELPRQEQLTHYFIAILCFIVAMLCKPSSVTLPLVIVGIDWLLLRSTLRQACAWSLPWLLASVPVVIIGLRAQPARQTGFIEYWLRPFIAGDALAFYVGKILWPMTLVIDYGRNPSWLKEQGSLMFITTGITVGLLALGISLRKRFPALLAALLVLIGATLPVLGLVTFEFEWYSTVADHYLYLAILGPAILVAAVLERWRLPVVYGAAGLVLALYAVRDMTQIAHWRTTNEMHKHVMAVNPYSPAGYYASGSLLAQQKRFEEAIASFREALSVRPDFGEAHYSLATALMHHGDFPEALKHYQEAERLLQGDADVLQNMGYVLYRLKRFDEAESAFRGAIKLNPAQAGAYSNLGALLMISNRYLQAYEAFEMANYLNPNDQAAQRNLEILRAMQVHRLR